jgi:hypothetical protein
VKDRVRAVGVIMHDIVVFTSASIHIVLVTVLTVVGVADTVLTVSAISVGHIIVGA